MLIKIRHFYLATTHKASNIPLSDFCKNHNSWQFSLYDRKIPQTHVPKPPKRFKLQIFQLRQPPRRRDYSRTRRRNLKKKMARGIFSCFGRPSFLTSAHCSFSSSAAADETPEEPGRCGPVVVELFSSQGCATSPVAELLVSRLGRGDFKLEMPVVVLAYHVDYWDYAGWKDPFGSSLWTVRQKAYVEALRLDTILTPQVVVQGRAHCVGSDEEALLVAVQGAPRFPALAFQATFTKTEQQTLQVTLTGSMRTKTGSDEANVIVALYENGLVTDCPSGENKGKVLSNDYVVRKLEKLCTVKDIIGKKSVTQTVDFGLWESFNSSKCGISVLVQNNEHHIFGSQNFKLPENLS